MAKRLGRDLGCAWCCIASGRQTGAPPARRFFVSIAISSGDLSSGVIVGAATSYFLLLRTWLKRREPPYGGAGVNVCM